MGLEVLGTEGGNAVHAVSTEGDTLLSAWNGVDDLWVFAYGSLIWRPNFHFVERKLVTLRGYHRALCLWSHDHRGSPEVPGIVFGLDRGGCCRGVAFRVPADQVRSAFSALWTREMLTGAYKPRWVKCDNADGSVRALAFLLNRTCSEYTGALPEERLISAIKQAVGKSGPCIEYVEQTHLALNDHGIYDKSLCAIVSRLKETPAPPAQIEARI